MAEWWFNTNYHSATNMTPYQAVYGQEPPSPIHYIPGASNAAAVDKVCQDREEIRRLLKEHLTQAQNRMKQQADKHRSERHFEEGEWVFLKLQPYKQSSLHRRSNMKLSPRFFGPFKILQKVGMVAYKLDLPTHSKLHPVFHVSQLKKKLGAQMPAQPTLPPVGEEGIPAPHPIIILDRRLVKHKGAPATQVLVQKSDYFAEDATWELYQELQAKFPTFQPWGQGLNQGGENVSRANMDLLTAHVKEARVRAKRVKPHTQAHPEESRVQVDIEPP